MLVCHTLWMGSNTYQRKGPDRSLVFTHTAMEAASTGAILKYTEPVTYVLWNCQ